MKIQTVYTWEKEDLGNGRWVTRQSSSPNSDNISFMCSVTYKLGFMLTSEGQKCVKVSVCDGMVLQFDGKKELLYALNNDSEGYRPTLPNEYKRMCEHLQRQCVEA